MKAADIKKLLASLLLAATFLGAFHHHNDTGIHHSCPVYVLHSNIISPDIPHESPLPEIDPVYQVFFSFVTSYPGKIISYGYLGRAPPTLS